MLPEPMLSADDDRTYNIARDQIINAELNLPCIAEDKIPYLDPGCMKAGPRAVTNKESGLPVRAGEPWPSTEDDLLKGRFGNITLQAAMNDLHDFCEERAVMHHRTANAIHCRLQHLGLIE